MNETLRRLLEERARIWGNIQEVRTRTAEGQPRSAEDTATLEAALNDLEAKNVAIRQEEALIRAEADMRAIGAEKAPETRGGAPAASQATSVRLEDTDAYRDAFAQFLVRGAVDMDPETRRVMLPAATDLRAQGIATGGAGGFLAPQGFLAKITETQKSFSSMLDVATVIDTDSGAALPWPSNDDSANIGSIVSENTAITDLDVTFGSKSLGAFMYTSRSVKVSYQLLQDAAFDVEAFLARKLGQRLGRVHNLHFTVGAGGGTEPQGIVTGLPVGVTAPAGNTTTLRYADLVALKHSIDPAYRNQARWLMSDAGVRALSLLVDTTGRPIWVPSLTVGAPDTLLGHPITINTDMAPLAANSKSVIFGDIAAAYLIRRVRGITLLRLNERFAEALQVGFLAFDRYDGIVDDAAAARVLQQSAT